ncbi:hotdog fold thioesterase [Streptomyces sp. NPDC005917]|uniref:PaaI family thioesterase n=1 Tax=unclassified Streptomyces TaxID=2593676 RepID=UPI0033EC156F
MTQPIGTPTGIEEFKLMAEVLPDDLPDDLGTLMREAGVGAGGLYWKLGIQLEEASAQLVVGTMPVEGNTQPQGLLHGGASIAFAETLASTAAAMYAGTRRVAVGVEVSATHHRSARNGTVRGSAQAVHLGSSMATYNVELTDERGRLLCSCRVSCMLKPRPALR